jgi:hypothetical protein
MSVAMKIFVSKREKTELENTLVKNILEEEDMLFVRGGFGQESGGAILE